jgi:hypothetical protein
MSTVERADRMHRRPRRRDGVEPVMFDNEVIALDTATATLHHLNVPATAFWSECDGSRTLREIADVIARRSGQPRATVEIQLLDLVDTMVARGLVALD